MAIILAMQVGQVPLQCSHALEAHSGHALAHLQAKSSLQNIGQGHIDVCSDSLSYGTPQAWQNLREQAGHLTAWQAWPMACHIWVLHLGQGESPSPLMSVLTSSATLMQSPLACLECCSVGAKTKLHLRQNSAAQMGLWHLLMQSLPYADTVEHSGQRPAVGVSSMLELENSASTAL